MNLLRITRLKLSIEMEKGLITQVTVTCDCDTQHETVTKKIWFSDFSPCESCDM
jgi:hypothetical protein